MLHWYRQRTVLPSVRVGGKQSENITLLGDTAVSKLDVTDMSKGTRAVIF